MSKILLHSHLIDLRLFSEDYMEYILPILPSDASDIVVLSRFAVNPDQNPQNIPFNDSKKMKWLLKIKSHFLYYCHSTQDQEIYIQSVLNDINYFYKPFITNAIEIDSDEYNEIVQKMLLHLSIIFAKQNFVEEEAYQAISIYRNIAQDSSKYTNQTINILFKILIGLVDFSISDNIAFNNSTQISQQILDLMFWILLISKDDDNWKKFNEITPKWPSSRIFVECWMKYFNSCLNIFSSNRDSLFFPIKLPFNATPEEALQLIVNMMKNIKELDKSQNSKILLQVFGRISDMVNQQQPKISDLFSIKWYADDIFELFSTCLNANPTESENSLISSIKICSKNMVRDRSVWVYKLTNNIINEFKNPLSQSSLDLIPNLNAFICSHPYNCLKIIQPALAAVKALIPKKSAYCIDKYIQIISLLLSISESVHSQDLVREINDNLYNSVNNKITDIRNTWQIQHLLNLNANDVQKTLKYLSHIMESAKSIDYFAYLVMLARFSPQVIKLPEFKEFLTHIEMSMVSKEHPKSEIVFYLFAYFICEVNTLTDDLQIASNERKILISVINHPYLRSQDNLHSIFEFCLIYSTPGVKTISSDVARRLENSDNAKYYQIRKSVVTLVPVQDDNKIIVIVRSSYGIFAFEVSESIQSESSDESDLPPFSPEVANKTESDEDIEDIDEDFRALSLLLRKKSNLIFKNPSQELKVSYPQIFSFLSGTGILTPNNIHRVQDIEKEKFLSFREKFDKLPTKDNIEIGILHFTPCSLDPPGSAQITPAFSRFLDSLGEPHIDDKGNKFRKIETSIVDYIFRYYTKSEFDISKFSILLVFNETDFECVEEKFREFDASVIISLRFVANNLMKLDLVKTDKGRDIAYPIMYHIPRLVGLDNMKMVITTTALLNVSNPSAKSRYSLGSFIKERQNVLNEICQEEVTSLAFLKDALELSRNF